MLWGPEAPMEGSWTGWGMLLPRDLGVWASQGNLRRGAQLSAVLAWLILRSITSILVEFSGCWGQSSGKLLIKIKWVACRGGTEEGVPLVKAHICHQRVLTHLCRCGGGIMTAHACSPQFLNKGPLIGRIPRVLLKRA